MNSNIYRQGSRVQRRVHRGSALPYAIVIMTVMSIIMTSILTFIAGQTKLSLAAAAKEQAFQIAESGLNYYQWYLAHQVAGKTSVQIDSFWQSGNPLGVDTPYEAEYTNASGEGIGKYKVVVIAPDFGYTSVTVKVTGWTYRYPDVKRTIKVRLRKPVWSDYAVVGNSFLRFGEGTEVNGKIFSNYGIRFDGVANNIVSSAVSSYNDPDHGGASEFGVHTHVAPLDPLPGNPVPDRSDVFRAGREFPTDTVDFEGVVGDLAYMKSIAQDGTNGSLYFDDKNQGQHIILKPNGTFDIRTVRSYSNGDNEINQYKGGWSTHPIPNNGVIFVENNVWVEGRVDSKRVTIVAANLKSNSRKSIFIGKDVLYTQYDCSEIIGLIAQGDIEIYKNSENDLRIDAALIAQTGKVGRDFYQGSTDSLKGTITLYGSLGSNDRYGFAWVDQNGNHKGGYATRNIIYDNNLLYCPPPFFPTKPQYEMDLWQEE